MSIMGQPYRSTASIFNKKCQLLFIDLLTKGKFINQAIQMMRTNSLGLKKLKGSIGLRKQIKITIYDSFLYIIIEFRLKCDKAHHIAYNNLI